MEKGREITPEPISEEKNFEKRDWFLLLTAAGIWGSSFLFMDVALESEHPGLITWLRPTLGLFALIWFPSARRPVESADRWSIVLLAITWVAFPFTMFPLAQQWIDSSITGMLNSAMPIMTLVIGALGFGVLIQRIQILGILVGIVGILFIGLPTVSGGGTNALGVLFVVLAVTSYGVGVNVAGPLQRKYGSLAVLSKVLIVASILTMPFGIYGKDSSVLLLVKDGEGRNLNQILSDTSDLKNLKVTSPKEFSRIASGEAKLTIILEKLLDLLFLIDIINYLLKVYFIVISNASPLSS